MELLPKTKMRIRTAVTDYQRMFPTEYQDLMKVVEFERQNLKTVYAELPETKGSGDWRLLATISEKLAQMISMKLNDEERLLFKERKYQRWFAKEFPQFAITKEI